MSLTHTHTDTAAATSLLCLFHSGKCKTFENYLVSPRPALPLLHLLLLASVEGLSPHRDRLKAATASSQPFLPRRILNSSGHTHTNTLTRENYVCACVIVCVIYVYVSCRCFCLRISFCRNRIRIRIRFKCEFISTKYYKSQRHTHTHRDPATHTQAHPGTHTHTGNSHMLQATWKKVIFGAIEFT